MRESSRVTPSHAISSFASAAAMTSGAGIALPRSMCTTVSGPQKTSWTPAMSFRKVSRTFFAVPAQVSFGVLAT